MQSDERRLLLLNTTNHPVRVAYPYAFVQVSEVARRHGIRTKRLDLFGVAPPLREALLRREMDEFRPQLVGVTLRNTDSLLSADYLRVRDNGRFDQPQNPNLLDQLTRGAPPYFPTRDTRDLVETVRKVTSVPIVMGGFGFSVQPVPLMRHLAPDFGVVGDPASMLEHFDDIAARRARPDIDNLCYFDGDQVKTNANVFAGPSPNREYVEEVVADRNRFFGAFAPNLPASSRAVPIEVMRGCPHRCTFCAEPKVKGNRAQFRDLDVVVDELEFLRTHGLNLVWFICSEINAMGNAFALELAERLIRINERRPEVERVRWFTYYLLRFARDELKTLRRSGFQGGWNDIPAFDDDNLRQLKVPYRTRHLLRSLRDSIAIGEEEAAARGTAPSSLEERILTDPDHRQTLLPDDMMTSPILTLFLGNQFAEVETVRRTLEVMDSEGLSARYDGAFVIRGERVFEHNERSGATSAPTLAFAPPGESAAVPCIDPTFRFSRALVDELGSLDEVERFFAHVEDTFLSRNHLFRKDWCWLLCNTLSPADFHGHWVAALGSGIEPAAFSTLPKVQELLNHVAACELDRTQLLFFPAQGRRHLASCAADAAIRATLEASPLRVASVWDALGIPLGPDGRSGLSEYRLAVHLYRRYADLAALRADVSAQLSVRPGSIEALVLADLLYRNNVQLEPRYRAFFVREPFASSES